MKSYLFQDQNSEKENRAYPSEDKPESDATQRNRKASILSKVQAFEQGPTRDDAEHEKDNINDTKREPKKLKRIQFYSTASQQDDAERRKREAEIRPLGGIVKVSY